MYKIGFSLINRIGWYWAVEIIEILEGRHVDRASCCDSNVDLPLTPRSHFWVVFFQSFCLSVYHSIHKRISSLNCWSSHFTLPHLSTHAHAHTHTHSLRVAVMRPGTVLQFQTRNPMSSFPAVLLGESKGGDCLGDLDVCDNIIEMDLTNMTWRGLDSVGWG